MIPFEVGAIYHRATDIHAIYSGQSQGGISTPAGHPYVFLFTGTSGEAYGYEDRWRPDGTFWYTGEGQSGDMEMVRGNRSIGSSDRRQVQQVVRIRSQAIKEYALKRADGICEGCGKEAPFHSKSGPFLEVHHVHRLGDGGPDDPENVISLCPNCHRRVHFAIDGENYNKSLIDKILRIEESDVTI